MTERALFLLVVLVSAMGYALFAYIDFAKFVGVPS